MTHFKEVLINSNYYLISNRLCNIIERELGSLDVMNFLFFSKIDLNKLAGVGANTIKEINALKKKILSDKDELSEVLIPERIFEKITIPIELYDVPTVKILLFKNDSAISNKYITRFAKKFNKLGEIDGYTYHMLLNIKGIGINVVNPIWEWFSTLYTEDFSNKVKYLFDLKPNFELMDFHYSCYLGHLFDKYNITSLDELSGLDNIPKDSLSMEDKLALLELRTIYKDVNGNLRTRTNHQTKEMNFFSLIDNYYTLLETKSQEIMQKRWGNETLSSLEEVGKSFNFTRERARQILQKLIDDFKSEYFNDFDNSFNYLARLFIEKRSYVNPKDLANSHERDWKLNENFYINFIQSIFKPIPFINTSEPSSEGNYRRVKVINDTKIELRKKSKLHISKYLKKYDLNDQVLLTTYALNPYGLIDILDDHFVLNSYKTSQWEDNYNKLQLFVGEHNRIPRSDKRIAETPKKELELGKWYRSLITKFRNGNLKKDRLKRLRTLIPDFGEKQRSTRIPWIESYNEYISFKSNHKREPKQNQKNQYENRLAMWALHNKQRFHRTTKIYSAPLSEKQLKLLNKINFDFSYTDIAERSKKIWDKKFNQLKYIAPPNFSKKEIGAELTRWLYQQKLLLNRGKLSNRRKAKLESIGVNLSIGYRKEIWLDNFNEYMNSNKIKSDSKIYVWFKSQKIRFRNNIIERYQLIKLIENDLLPPIDDLESDWDNYYHSAKYFLSNNKNILKVIMDKPNKLYTWLIYYYCMFKLGKLNDVRMLKFAELEIKESIFDQ